MSGNAAAGAEPGPLSGQTAIVTEDAGAPGAEPGPLSGRTAIVTGGAKGIGRAIADGLAAAGLSAGAPSGTTAHPTPSTATGAGLGVLSAPRPA